MKIILASLILWAVGCTPLVVKKPIGSNYNPEQLREFEGTWVLKSEGEEPKVIHLKLLNDQGRFRKANVEWNEKEKWFDVLESDVILKKGNEYGILHFAKDDEEDNPHGLILITLFQIKDNGDIEYWYTSKDGAAELLESGILKTESIDGDPVIIDQPKKIIQTLESRFDDIFDPNSTTTAKKLSPTSR